MNSKLTGSLEGLSKRQRKRLNRRLSRSKDNTPETIPPIPENVLQSRTNSESSDWQTVRRSSAVLPPNNINGVTRNIELENMFGFLNNSQHDEETVPRVPSRYKIWDYYYYYFFFFEKIEKYFSIQSICRQNLSY